jgi:hypothetical protein
MAIRSAISIGNLLLDLSNYRHGKSANQKEARDAIIANQGKKLVTLASDILENGLNPSDLPIVVDAEDGNGNFIVIEGNRRLTAAKLLIEPELGQGTSIYNAFKRLSKSHGDAIPKVFECVVVPSKTAGLTWINRKHASGLEGAGTEHWSAIAKARAEVEQGIARPDLDAINFVLSNPNLENELKNHLEGSDFRITTLNRILTTQEAQPNLGIAIKDGKLVANKNSEWLMTTLTEIINVIAKEEYEGEKFTVENIYSLNKRIQFIDSIVKKQPQSKVSKSEWIVSGSPIASKRSTSEVKSTKKPSKPSTDTTEDRSELIPKKFKLELPSGKINDVWDELKKLDVVKYRHAVSVLFRVFLEFSLDHYVKKFEIELPKNGKGQTVDSLKTRLEHVLKHVKSTKLMADGELKPLNHAISNKNSLLAPDTLNAYVHSSWLNPDPLQLKLTWNNAELFIERLWQSKK